MSNIFVEGARKFFDICETRNINVEADIRNAEAGNELVGNPLCSCTSLDEIIAELQNLAEMNKQKGDNNRYHLKLRACGLDKDGNSYEFDSADYHFLTAEEMLDLLESDSGRMRKLVERYICVEQVSIYDLITLRKTTGEDLFEKAMSLIPEGKDPVMHELADPFEGESFCKICGDAVCMSWVECWTLDDNFDCIDVDIFDFPGQLTN